MLANKTHDTITERPLLIRVGLLFFMARPLTLAQLWRVGAIVAEMPELNLEGRFNPMAKVLERPNDFRLCTEIFIALLFRSWLSQKLFGWYIRKHLTPQQYAKLLTYTTQSFDASFFLTNLTFLKGIKTVTSQTNTDEAIALGDSLEE